MERISEDKHDKSESKDPAATPKMMPAWEITARKKVLRSLKKPKPGQWLSTKKTAELYKQASSGLKKKPAQANKENEPERPPTPEGQSVATK